MNTYVIVSEKKWNRALVENLQSKFKSIRWVLIDDKDDFNVSNLKKQGAVKVFIPHWSYMIPEEIYSNYECIVFHMTDLPYGRGGSPMQNLIVRGHTTTKISALKVGKKVDAGPVYLKKELSLAGTAADILMEANKVIEGMIFEIISGDLKPLEQQGEVVHFKRRKPGEGNMSELEDLKQVYDYIRMLDAEGYPHAFLETSGLKFEFTMARFKEGDNTLTAHVRIFKK